jgi:hypothetical protein
MGELRLPFFLFIHMSFPTSAVSTELDAVNQILSSVGQAPVTTLDLQNPEVSIARNTLIEMSRQVQGEGWTFNTERKLDMARDQNNKIVWPSDYITIDGNEYHNGQYDIVKRAGYLYDRYKHTSIFTENLKCDVVKYFNFIDLPQPVQAYITAKAARMCATKMVGDAQLNQLLAEQEAQTRANIIEYECQQGDYSYYGFNDGENTYNSYQPFHALKR